MSAATVVLTYKPESTPIDPVRFADAARAWQDAAAFPMTIDACGCSVAIELTGTTSGYEEFNGKGTPKSGKCKGGSSAKNGKKGKTGKKGKKGRKAKNGTSLALSVGPHGTTAAAATASAAAVLVAIVAMVLIKRRFSARYGYTPIGTTTSEFDEESNL
jgi:hypothetical protein